MMYVSYQTSFEEQSYDAADPYDGQVAGELTCPAGWLPGYKKVGKRPEWDLKIFPQPEVRTGLQAAGFFSTWSEMKACLYKEFHLTPGAAFRVTAWGMGVASGIGAGMRLVVAMDGSLDWEAAGDAHPEWEWWSNYNENKYDRQWRQFVAEGRVGLDGTIVVFLVGHTDSSSIEHHGTHWDDVLLEVEETTPPSGDVHTVKLYVDDVLQFERQLSGRLSPDEMFFLSAARDSVATAADYLDAVLAGN